MNATVDQTGEYRRFRACGMRVTCILNNVSNVSIPYNSTTPLIHRYMLPCSSHILGFTGIVCCTIHDERDSSVDWQHPRILLPTKHTKTLQITKSEQTYCTGNSEASPMSVTCCFPMLYITLYLNRIFSLFGLANSMICVTACAG